MGRLVLAAWLGLLLVSAPAFAADSAAEATSGLGAAAGISAMAALVAAVPAGVAAPVADASTTAFVTTAPVSGRSSNDFVGGRPAILPALYLGSAALQGYDAYSTLTAIKLGGHEANPLMKSAVSNPAVLIGIKAAMTVSATMAAERMWKHNNRVGAVVVMVLSDGLMSAVAMHNASVVNSLR